MHLDNEICMHIKVFGRIHTKPLLILVSSKDWIMVNILLCKICIFVLLENFTQNLFFL